MRLIAFITLSKAAIQMRCGARLRVCQATSRFATNPLPI